MLYLLCITKLRELLDQSDRKLGQLSHDSVWRSNKSMEKKKEQMKAIKPVYDHLKILPRTCAEDLWSS